MPGVVITPDELRRIAHEQDMAKAREALEKKRKVDDEHHQLYDAFMAREIPPDVFERFSKVVRAAAERGEREMLALRFSSEHCTDGGLAINSFEPEWPGSLTGFAKRAYEFWQKKLEPQGYKLRAQIMDIPGGLPGDVGMFSQVMTARRGPIRHLRRYRSPLSPEHAMRPSGDIT
jgi:hypothetical protein